MSSRMMEKVGSSFNVFFNVSRGFSPDPPPQPVKRMQNTTARVSFAEKLRIFKALCDFIIIEFNRKFYGGQVNIFKFDYVQYPLRF